VTDDDLSYFKRRAAEERALAQESGPAGHCHWLMAQRYAHRVRALERHALGLTPAEQHGHRHGHRHQSNDLHP